MQVLGSSITEAVQTYLHSGYISAYPRPLEGYVLEGAEPSLTLDMAQALQLQGETLASALTHFSGHGLASMAAAGDVGLLLAGGVAFFGALGLASRKSPGRTGLAVAAAAILGVAAVGCETETEALEAPWKDVAIQEYVNPEAATQAILYGIVADGLANTDRTVHSLADIQYEVALPTAHPTEGMQYALQTYGLDGWGKELRLESVGAEDTAEEIDDAWIVTSAGADGAFDTDDDIAISVMASTDGTWDNNRWAFFVDGSGDEMRLWFHRWSGDHFEYNHQTEVEAELGHTLVDYMDMSVFYDEDTKARLQSDWDEASAEVSHTPLLLQVYRQI